MRWRDEVPKIQREELQKDVTGVLSYQKQRSGGKSFRKMSQKSVSCQKNKRQYELVRSKKYIINSKDPVGRVSERVSRKECRIRKILVYI